MKIKDKGFLYFHRKQIIESFHLTDAEYRLRDIYRAIVDWDSKHDNYATTDLSNIEIKEIYWPTKSPQAIGRARKGLLRNGEIESWRYRGRTVTRVIGFETIQNQRAKTNSGQTRESVGSKSD